MCSEPLRYGGRAWRALALTGAVGFLGLPSAVSAADAQAAVQDAAIDETVADEAPAGEDMVQVIEELVREMCGVTPGDITEGGDAYRVRLFLDNGDRRCLDEVVMLYDRRHASGRTLAFEVTATPDRPSLPVMHVSSIEIGPFAHIRLRDGQTLFPGAVVGGWTLEAIGEDASATLVQGEQRFVLSLDDKVRP